MFVNFSQGMTWTMLECMDGILIQKVNAVLFSESLFCFLLKLSHLLIFFWFLLHFQWNTAGSRWEKMSRYVKSGNLITSLWCYLTRAVRHEKIMLKYYSFLIGLEQCSSSVTLVQKSATPVQITRHNYGLWWAERQYELF